MFYIVVAPFYILTNSALEFQFLCILVKTCYYLSILFYCSHSNGCDVNILFLLCLLFVLPSPTACSEYKPH